MDIFDVKRLKKPHKILKQYLGELTGDRAIAGAMQILMPLKI